MGERKPVSGIIYLIHFKTKYKHAQHYLGWARDLLDRLERHLSNSQKRRGSALMNAIHQHGIPFKVVRTWDGTRDEERRLHDLKNNPELCPICRGQVSYDNAIDLTPDSI